MPTRDALLGGLAIMTLLVIGLWFIGDGPPAQTPHTVLAAPTVPTTAPDVTTTQPAPLAPATVAERAVRSTTRVTYETLPPPPTVPTGLKGMPFAPPELTGCDRMEWYADQAGLPDDFGWIGWAESRCRNDVSTWCCYGYFQIHELHIGTGSDIECDVRSVDDYYGANGLDRQRNACMAVRVLRQQGVCAWDVVRC